MHDFGLIGDCVDLPDRVWNEVGGTWCVKATVLHDTFSIFEVNVHPLAGSLQEEAEGKQKLASW